MLVDRSKRAIPFEPTVEQLKELHFYSSAAMARSRTATRALRNRSRALLDLAGGEPTGTIARRYKVGTATISYWRKEYEKKGTSFISSYGPHAGPGEYDPEDVRARVIKAIETNGSAVMSRRRLSQLTNISAKALYNHRAVYSDLVTFE